MWETFANQRIVNICLSEAFFLSAVCSLKNNGQCTTTASLQLSAWFCEIFVHWALCSLLAVWRGGCRTPIVRVFKISPIFPLLQTGETEWNFETRIERSQFIWTCLERSTDLNFTWEVQWVSRMLALNLSPLALGSRFLLRMNCRRWSGWRGRRGASNHNGQIHNHHIRSNLELGMLHISSRTRSAKAILGFHS